MQDAIKHEESAENFEKIDGWNKAMSVWGESDSLRPVTIIDNVLPPLSHLTHLLDSPDLECMTWRIVCVFEGTVAEDVVGAFTIHLINVLLRVVLRTPQTDHGKGRTRPLLRWLESGLVVLLTVLESYFLCTSNPLKSGYIMY